MRCFSVQGVASDKMFYIKEGRVDLILKRPSDTDVELATRQVTIY